MMGPARVIGDVQVQNVQEALPDSASSLLEESSSDSQEEPSSETSSESSSDPSSDSSSDSSSESSTESSTQGAGEGSESAASVDEAVDELDLDVVGTLVEQVRNYATSFIESLPNMIAAVVILVLTFVVALIARSLVEKAMRRANIRRALISLTRTLTGVAVWIVGLLVTMAVLFPSVEPASVLTAMGVGGIAIGFAFKDIFENFMAGAMIMLRKPMHIGDYIECEDVEGEVENIMIRDTYIRKNDGQLVILPNSMLYKNPVYVLTDRRQRRFEIIAGVSYDTDVDEAREIIRDAVGGLDAVDSERGIDVFACEFNDSSIDFRVRWWAASTPRDGHESTDVVVAAIKRALDEAGIEIPFPYRTLTFGESLQLQQVEDTEERTTGRNTRENANGNDGGNDNENGSGGRNENNADDAEAGDDAGEKD
ncbi:mechanosensitive ion channel family protein [Halomonas denitrificans]|nr:mechanosensitive ion channel family protein [Halomonas denitrificans]